MMAGSWRHPLRALSERVGRVYVPGAELDDALRVARGHAQAGRACTLGCFNDAQEDAFAVADRTAAIADALSALPAGGVPGYVSIKAPALRYELDALDRVLDRCRDHGLRAHFDSHDVGNAELTLACVEHAAIQRQQPAGLTLPGRWARSVDDAAHLVALGVRPRVVKGEWPDPADPRADPREGALAVVDALLKAGAPDVALASHDVSLVREAIDRLQPAGVRCTIELLHGLPMRDVLALAAQRALPVVVYVPFGIAWRPYALRQVLRRPRIAAWVLHDLLRGAR